MACVVKLVSRMTGHYAETLVARTIGAQATTNSGLGSSVVHSGLSLGTREGLAMSDILSQWATDDSSTESQDDSESGEPSKTYPTFWEDKHPVAFALCSKKGALREAPKDTEHGNIGGWFDSLIQGLMPLIGEFENGYKQPSESRFPVKYIPNLVEALSEATVEAFYEENYKPLLELFEPGEDSPHDAEEFYRQLAEFLNERADEGEDD